MRFDHGDQLSNYLFDGRRKLTNKVMRGVSDLSINNSLCTPSTATGRHRSEGSSCKTFIILKLYCCAALRKAVLLLL